MNVQNIIVTRHAGAVEWLRGQGITGEVISHVGGPEQVRGRTVIGNVPMHLAAEAACVGVIELPQLRPEQRGKELTVEEMVEAGACLRWYVVTPATTPEHATYLSGVLMHG